MPTMTTADLIRSLGPEAASKALGGARRIPRVKIPSDKTTGPERAYGEHLAVLKANGEIEGFKFHPDPLPLGQRCRYEPDYAVFTFLGGFQPEYIEVKATYPKGPKRGKPIYKGDARTKVLWVAHAYPKHHFYVVWLADGMWKKERVEP